MVGSMVRVLVSSPRTTVQLAFKAMLSWSRSNNFCFFCRFHNCALHTWYAFVLSSSFQSLLDFEFSILIPNESMTQFVFCAVYIGLEAGLASTLQWKTCV